MYRLSLLCLVVLASTTLAAPNVVVLLADDQGWGDLSGHGNRNLRTPHIDALARDGATFERFFVQPVCSPTRAEFLIGRYAQRGGVRNVSLGGERLNLDEETIADVFKAAGYRTGLFGKWHNGTQYPYHPNGRGFTEFYGYTSGHWGEYFDATLDHNGADVRTKGYMTDDITDKAVGFIAKAHTDAKPFFCVLSFNTPHSPMQVPDAAYNRFARADLTLQGTNKAKEDLLHTRAALAMCENIDTNVGRVLKQLETLKLDTNTIVVYFSDNGPNGHRWNGGMKGIKGSTDEGGVRSPLHVRWPAKITPRKVPHIAAAIDLRATLQELCGLTAKPKHPLDGKSLAPLLTAKETHWPERTLFQHWNGRISARSQRYRLDADGQLFDMQDDPGQTKPITTQSAITKQMTTARDAWRADAFAMFSRGDARPYPVGYEVFPRTMLPARDGTFAGGIQRSSGAPNCSYFTNWTTKEGRLYWNLDVQTTGTYEAILHYTCAADAVGTKLELRCVGAQWTGTLPKAHDPALRGKDHDRSPRGSESYMKDFATVSLGTAKMERGQGTLALRALDVLGKQVADVWALELILRK